jgi:hypothetical protein
MSGVDLFQYFRLKQFFRIRELAVGVPDITSLVYRFEKRAERLL